jgi:ubiquinone/menaquinone biosynthesis C-methylase UbiE
MQSPGVLRVTWLVKAYLWATELLYGPFAWAYDAVAWLVSFGFWSRWRLDALAFLKPGSVLEIGFGTGKLLIALAESGLDVTGLELSPQMHRVTARKLNKRERFIKCVRASAKAIPFTSEAFDNIISTFPSNYILADEVLCQIRRVLDRQGRCIVLGLGVQFTSGIKRRLTNLWMGSAMDEVIQHFIQSAQKAGFSATRVDHQTQAYLLPVLILERNNAD